MNMFRAVMKALLVIQMVAVVGLQQAAAAEVEWRFASKLPPDSPEGRTHQYFAEQVAKYSNGRMNITIFPSEQLGKGNAVMEQLQMGAIHLYAEGPQYPQKWVPEIKLTAAAFLFDDRNHWVRFMDSELVKGWYKKAEEKAGVKVLGNPATIWRGPYRVMLSTVPIADLNDVSKLKLRLPADRMQTATWNELGAEVRTIAFTEVYEAMKRGIVNSVNLPISLAEVTKVYEVAKYVTPHKEFYQSISYMMNKRAWDRLPADLQQALLRAHEDLAEYSLKQNQVYAEKGIEIMKKNGVTFGEIDRTPFVDAMRAYYQREQQAGNLPVGFLETVQAAK